MAVVTERIESIDDFLGASETRFFADGFRKIRQRVSQLRIEQADGTGTVRATAGVHYPTDWSKKDETALRPHLSSIDALLVAVQLGEAFLTHAHGLDGVQRRAMWLRRFVMKAGSAPQENLEAFDATAVHVETVPGVDSPLVSVFDCQVGSIKVRTEIAHEAFGEHRGASPGPAFHQHLDDLLGEAAGRHYGEGYKLSRSTVGDVLLDLPEGRVEATAKVVHPGGPEGSQGLGGDHHASLSMFDALTVLAQLGQVLLYRLDGITRQTSNTLWLREVTISCDRPDQALGQDLTAVSWISKSQRFEHRGATWRSAALEGTLGGFSTHCALVHQLPDGVEQ
ncbi:AvrD family protein [Streptomyces sp. NBC_00454]|uniref:AvrD family protein n=1 Tax=Streptomyces sp. NBC_00454 TaxID=2975747 RepID=UPI0030E1D6F7